VIQLNATKVRGSQKHQVLKQPPTGHQLVTHWSPTGHPLVTNWSPTGFQCGAPNAFGAYKGAASQHQYECPTNIVRLIHNQLLTRFIPPGV